MIDSIKDKIRSLISQGLENLDEYKTVFLLTRIRKVIETEQSQSTYPYLWFYCNWSVHNYIDRENTTRILREQGIFVGNELAAPEVEFMGHVQFFSELSDFSRQVLNIELNTNAPNPAREHLSQLLDEIYCNVPITVEICRKYTTKLLIERGARCWQTIES